MTTKTALDPGEIGVEASAAIRDLLGRAIQNEQVASYVEAEPLRWEVLAEGGRDMVGAAEDDGGAGATLRDLADIAIAWGEAIVPLPFIPTLMAKRWSPAARETEGPVTVAVANPAAGGRGVAPFGLEPSVVLLTSSGPDGGVSPISDGVADDYAPSLRLVETVQTTRLDPASAAELAVVWAAESTGAGMRMLADAIAFAKQRHQFGQPIGRFQAVKHQLANAHMLAEQAETAVLWASVEPRHARQAATIAHDFSLRVVEMAIQVHGGLGFTWEMGLHMYLRHINSLRELTVALPL